MKTLRLTVALLLLLVVAACTDSKAPQLAAEGKVIPAAQLPLRGHIADPNFVPVRKEALPFLYQDFRDVLFRQGLARWDPSFDCNRITSLYISLAQARHAVQRFYVSGAPSSLALAEVWFKPDKSKTYHTIAAVVTEDGLIFIEPQTGKEWKMTPTERQSIYFVKW